MQAGLLEYLYDCSQEYCISDLRDPFVFRRYLLLLNEIDTKRFPLASWEYAYSYLSKRQQHFSSIEDARKAIIAWAEEKEEAIPPK